MVAVPPNGVAFNEGVLVLRELGKMENCQRDIFHFSLMKYTSGLKGEGRSIGGAI